MASLSSLRRRPPASTDEQPEELRKLLEKVKRRVEQEMDPLHKQYRDRWDMLGGLYHNFDQLRSAWRDASTQSQTSARGVLLDAQRSWGGHLVIPYAYATVETVVPRVVAQRPRFIARALASIAEERVGPIQDAVNQQLADIDLELKLQPLVRRACKMGLGVQFTYWQERTRKVVQWGRDEAGQMVPTMSEVMDRKGPQVEDIDIYDWMWDPTAKSVENCEDILYRTWRPFSYIERMVKQGRELRKAVKQGGWFDIDLDAVKRMGRAQARNELWSGRLEAQGLTMPTELKEGNVHEVWSYFTKDRIVTILDKQLVVQNDVSPLFHREFPFQIYRPTPVEGQLPGLGVVDAIENLIAELSTMRTQRRDAATVALNPPTFYSRGMIERRHMKSGPGVWIPVTGDIREAVWQPSLRDIPASGYEEEDRLKQDIETTSGMSDVMAGGSGSGQTAGTETATGIQLIQAAANVRIAGMANLLLLEALKPFGRQVLELNRQHQIEATEVRVEDQHSESGYRFETITPQDWQLPLELVPEDHSNEPENRPQKIDEATRLFQLVGQDPSINHRELNRYTLEAWGIRNPDRWLAGEMTLNPQMAQVVAQSFQGTLKVALQGLLGDEQQASQAAEEITMQAMTSAMQQVGVSPDSGQNGSQPQEVPSG